MDSKYPSYQYSHYLILDKNKEILYFNNALYRAFFHLFNKRLKLNSPIEHFIPQNSTLLVRDYFIADKVKKNVLIADKNLELEITCNKILDQQGQVFYVFEARSIGSPKTNPSSTAVLNRYSFLTSHALRAPLSTILSLSAVFNNSQLESYDLLKIKELFANIQEQAERLDEIIVTINKLLNAEGYNEQFIDQTISKGISDIVLVDDDIFIIKIHERLINQYFPTIRVTAFINPKLALEYICRSPPDLILLDINMPEIDGWQFLEAMEDKNTSTEVVMVSSSINLTDRASASRFTRVKRFIEKPLSYHKIQSFLDS
ncbi:MAG: response regulator [Bacteroidota bacterium]